MSNMVVRTNISAINAHRHLGMTGKTQRTAAARMSSGFRINSAADDAAGLAISEKMRGQIRGLNQASRNAQDGVSLIQTAEGAMSTVSDMIIRMRELVIQAANDTNVHEDERLSFSDRLQIQREVDQIMQEINAVAARTEFNTRTLLDGSLAWEENPVTWLSADANHGSALVQSSLDMFFHSNIANIHEVFDNFASYIMGNGSTFDDWLNSRAPYGGDHSFAQMGGFSAVIPHIFQNLVILDNSSVPHAAEFEALWEAMDNWAAAKPAPSPSFLDFWLEQTGAGGTITLDDIMNLFSAPGDITDFGIIAPAPFAAPDISLVPPFGTPPDPDVIIPYLLNDLMDGQSGVGWSFNNGVLTIDSSEVVQVNGNGDVTSNTIVMTSTGDLILNNVNIESASTPLDFGEPNQTRHNYLWLVGDNRLMAIGGGNAGVRITGGNSLIIDGHGSLEAIGHGATNASSGAAIGGGGADIDGAEWAAAGTIRIDGGHIIARGAGEAAAIGGGSQGTSGRGVDNVLINSGIIRVYPGSCGGTAIGGGCMGGRNNANITIHHGIITIAAVGGGPAFGGEITMYDGLVEIAGGRATTWGGEMFLFGGNLSAHDPQISHHPGNPTQITDTNGNHTYAVRIFLYDPDGEPFVFPPFTPLTFTFGGETHTLITDSGGRLFAFMPNNSEGETAEMLWGSPPAPFEGALINFTQDHGAHLVFVPEDWDEDIPAPPGWPLHDFDDIPDPDIDDHLPDLLPQQEGPLWFQLGANAGQGLFVGIGGVTTEILGDADGDLAGLIDVLHSEGYDIQRQIPYLDRALAHVSGERAMLGAIQNRLEFTINNVQIASENLSSAESRIRDADMALEMMRLTQSNILQEAATSMLSQANQSPQAVLQLLQ